MVEWSWVGHRGFPYRCRVDESDRKQVAGGADIGPPLARRGRDQVGPCDREAHAAGKQGGAAVVGMPRERRGLGVVAGKHRRPARLA